MTKNLVCAFALSVATLSAGCQGGTAANQNGALSAGPAARAFGVDHYTIEAHGAAFFDAYGVEIGHMSITSPAATDRRIAFDTVDGQHEDIDVSNAAPEHPHGMVVVETLNTAVLVDPALAALLLAHDMTFSAGNPSAMDEGLAPSNIANTTACTTPSGTPWTNNDGSGCARPANTSLGCTNSASYPATATTLAPAPAWGSVWQTSAIELCASWCQSDGNPSGVSYFSSGSACVCSYNHNYNTWTASCPPSTCSAPNYDGVPRRRNCVDPGTCTNSQGAISCVSWH